MLLYMLHAATSVLGPGPALACVTIQLLSVAGHPRTRQPAAASPLYFIRDDSHIWHDTGERTSILLSGPLDVGHYRRVLVWSRTASFSLVPCLDTCQGRKA